MIWPQALSPESLATSFGTSMSGDLDFISISRKKHKTAFKKKDSWGDIGIKNIRELSEAFGLPTHLKTIVENRPLTAKELHKQWKASTLTLFFADRCAKLTSEGNSTLSSTRLRITKNGMEPTSTTGRFFV